LSTYPQQLTAAILNADARFGNIVLESGAEMLGS
jgi:hypothetical protein